MERFELVLLGFKGFMVVINFQVFPVIYSNNYDCIISSAKCSFGFGFVKILSCHFSYFVNILKNLINISKVMLVKVQVYHKSDKPF